MNYTIMRLIIVPVFFFSVHLVNAQTVKPTGVTSISPTAKITLKPTLKISVSPTLTSLPVASSSAKTITPEDKNVTALRENVATKVAELRKKGQKAIAGSISVVKGTTLDIKTPQDITYTVKMDESLTKAYQITGTTKKEMKQSDFKKGMYIIISGPIIDKTITANVIYVDQQILNKSGKLTEVNTTDSLLKISTTERDTVTLDLPARFKFAMMNSKTLDIETTTLSKIKEGDTIHFVYAKTGTEKDSSRFDALKILIIPQEFFQTNK